MTTATRALVDEALSEREFQQQIIDLAQLSGWLVWHDPDVQRCRNCGATQPDRREAGWPDLAMLRPPFLWLAEVKTQKGRVSPEQQAWLGRLGLVRIVQADVLRPKDWPTISRALRSKGR